MYAPIGVLVRGCVPNFGQREWFYEKVQNDEFSNALPPAMVLRTTEARDLENFADTLTATYAPLT